MNTSDKREKSVKTNENLLAQLNKRRQLLLHMLGSKTHKCNFSNILGSRHKLRYRSFQGLVHGMQQYWQSQHLRYLYLYVACNNLLKHQYGRTLKYRHLQMRSRKYHLQISETLLRPPGTNTEGQKQRQRYLHISLVANKHPMSQWKMTKATSTLHTKESSSMQLQTRTDANPCKRQPEHKQRGNNVLYLQ
jgi:hypothetical protein